MADEDVWRRRFFTFILVRLAGLATFIFGVAIMYTNLVRAGGWPSLGAVIAIMGAIDSLFAPKLLRKMWEQQDR